MIEDTGKRIKALRMARKMSMADLSSSIGTSKSLISQVERGEVLPSLTTLEKIATALDVPISKFFQIDTDAAGQENIIVRSDERKVVTIPGSKSVYNVLTPSLHTETEFLLIEYPPKAGFVDKPDYFIHDGEEHFYVLQGCLDFTVNGNTYQLHQGDSGSFNSSNVHYFVNKSDQPAKIIICATKPAL